MTGHGPPRFAGERARAGAKPLFLAAVVCAAFLLSGCLTFFPLEITDGGDRYYVLKNLVVEFDELHFGDGKPFLEFGAVVDGEEGKKRLPTFEYIVSSDAAVVSPVDGVVTKTEYQENSSDYAVWIQPLESPNIFIEIDHVTNLQVKKGQRVSAEDLLGNPGTWDPNSGIGRVELMVKLMGVDMCPFALFDPSLREDYESMVKDFMEKWHKYVSEHLDEEGEESRDELKYDQSAMVAPGCYAWSYTEEELFNVDDA